MLKGNIFKMWFYLNLEHYLPHAADVTCDDWAETSAVLRSKNKMGFIGGAGYVRKILIYFSRNILGMQRRI